MTTDDIELWRKQVNESYPEQSVPTVKHDSSPLIENLYYEKPETELVETLSRFHITDKFGGTAAGFVAGSTTAEKAIIEIKSVCDRPTEGKQTYLKQSSRMPLLFENPRKYQSEYTWKEKGLLPNDKNGKNENLSDIVNNIYPKLNFPSNNEGKESAWTPIWKQNHNHFQNLRENAGTEKLS